MKWLYRLEAISPDNGLWYNQNNEMVFGIGKLSNCKTKELPMGYDERYHKDGKNWFSSCSKKEDLSHWYFLEDALELLKHHNIWEPQRAVVHLVVSKDEIHKGYRFGVIVSYKDELYWVHPEDVEEVR